jgi:hypothetical protein
MLTDAIIDFFDLAEAEGRLLKKKVVETLVVALLVSMAAAMLLTSLGLILTALYHALANILPPSLVFLLMAILSILMAGGILWIAIRLNRRQ